MVTECSAADYIVTGAAEQRCRSAPPAVWCGEAVRYLALMTIHHLALYILQQPTTNFSQTHRPNNILFQSMTLLRLERIIALPGDQASRPARLKYSARPTDGPVVYENRNRSRSRSF